MKKRVNNEELIGNGQKTVEVYLKWVGVRMGAYFESAQDGPYDVVIRGDAVSVDGRDMTELQAERAHLETSCLCSGLSLHMAEVLEGSVLGDWRPVVVGAVVMKKRGETKAECGNCKHASFPRGLDIGTCGDQPMARWDSCALFERADEEAGPDDPYGLTLDMCRCQCQAGGECSRKVCSGAAALAREVLETAEAMNAHNWGEVKQAIIVRCEGELEADASLPHAPECKFRVASTRHGAVGEETNYLYIFDVDGDVEVYFMEGAEKAWSGSADKASALVAVIKETTGDETVRVEEVRS